MTHFIPSKYSAAAHICANFGYLLHVKNSNPIDFPSFPADKIPVAMSILHRLQEQESMVLDQLYAEVSQQYPKITRLEHGLILSKLLKAGLISNEDNHLIFKLLGPGVAACKDTDGKADALHKTSDTEPSIKHTTIQRTMNAPDHERDLHALTLWIQEGHRWLHSGEALLEKLQDKKRDH